MTNASHIIKIRFDRVGRNEGCTCDRCGQYIRNIWTVVDDNGMDYRFGLDCFETIQKMSLNAYGQKVMKKLLKKIEYYNEMIKAYKEMTEENDKAWLADQQDTSSYWYGREYSEYHEWMLNKWYPARLADCEKELKRFERVRFRIYDKAEQE